jgi:lipopolysaccharide transport system ATP-binding protein
LSNLIEVRNLTKRFRVPVDRSSTLKYRVSHLISTARYRAFMAVDDVSFDVPEGQFLGIIGANGSGKSTLLKILAGIYRPTSGSVRVNGNVSPFLELGVGFNPELTARENVFVNGAILGLSRPELQRRMEGILHFAELEDFADQKLKNFSSGMQVRLAFTVAIQADAEILLMDEVLAVGDARFQAKCFEVFARYRRQGKTVILVTHDLDGVQQHCDRAILFEHGKMVADGAATEVTTTYRRLSSEDSEDGSASLAGEEGGAKTRWGNGAVSFSEVEILSSGSTHEEHLKTGCPVKINLRLHARDAVDDLVVGVSVHTADGTYLTGTNTMIEGVRVPPLAPGDDIRLAYDIGALRLLDGAYRMDIAAVSARLNTTFDWFEGAATFRVTDTIGRRGIVDLGGEFRIEPGA